MHIRGGFGAHFALDLAISLNGVIIIAAAQPALSGSAHTTGGLQPARTQAPHIKAADYGNHFFSPLVPSCGTTQATCLLCSQCF